MVIKNASTRKVFGKVYMGIPPETANFFPILTSTTISMGTSIKRTLSDYDMPTITINIGGNEFEALIDTGSFYCQLNAAAIILPEGGDTVKINRPDIGIVTKTRYLFDFTVESFDKIFSEEFVPLSFEGVPYDAIVGTLFLSKCQSFIYNGKEGFFELTV